MPRRDSKASGGAGALSFFQSLSASERAELLDIAPMLRGVRHEAPPVDPPTERVGDVLGVVGGGDSSDDSDASSGADDDDDETGTGTTRAAGARRARRRRRDADIEDIDDRAIASATATTPATIRRGVIKTPLTSTSTRAGVSGGASPYAPSDVTRDIANRESDLRFEVERLRATNARLESECDAARARLDASRRAHLAMECALTEQTRALDDARTRAIGEGAMRAGAAEDACARQRRMLRDLAVASEGLARDNAALSAELDACRARLERSCEDNRALHDKVRSAQRLYLAGQRDAEARVEEDDLRGGWARKMDALCANEALSESRPPASFTGVRNARSLSVTGGSTPPATTSRSDNPNSTNRHVAGDLFQERQKLRHEVSRLTRRLRDAANRASNAEEELRRVKEIAAERRMADARRRDRDRKQLAGAVRRLRWLVERVSSLESAAKETDRYVEALEGKLLKAHARAINRAKTAKLKSHTPIASMGRGEMAYTLGAAGVGGTEWGRRIASPRFAADYADDDGSEADELLDGLNPPGNSTASGVGGVGSGWVAGSDRASASAAVREALAMARRAREEGEVETDGDDGDGGGDCGGGGDGGETSNEDKPGGGSTATAAYKERRRARSSPGQRESRPGTASPIAMTTASADELTLRDVREYVEGLDVESEGG